jgi:hypothetical protein
MYQFAELMDQTQILLYWFIGCYSFFSYFSLPDFIFHCIVLYGKICPRENRSIKSEGHLHYVCCTITVVVKPWFSCGSLFPVPENMYY